MLQWPQQPRPLAHSNFKFKISQLIGPLVGALVMLGAPGIADSKPIGPATVYTRNHSNMQVADGLDYVRIYAWLSEISCHQLPGTRISSWK
jgi:hypothetical protein